MSFARPELLLLLVLAPLTAALAAVLWRRRLRATEAWASRALWGRLLGRLSHRRLGASVALLTIAVLGAGLALAQPRWGESRQTVERRGVDVVVVLDASLSMGVKDVEPSRMAVAETLIRRLVQAAPGHRFALVAAEGDGVVMAPLTTDAAVIDLLLDGIEPGSLPIPGTRLADSLERLPELYPPSAPTSSGRHRAAILVSDGEDHGGALAEGVETVAEAGVIVHAIGVGTPEGGPVPIPGHPGDVRRRPDGSVVMSRLDETTLETVARGTGGVYLRGTDPGRDLSPILSALAGMEGRAIETSELETRAERFQWPLGLAVVALLAYLLLSPFAPRRRTVAQPAQPVTSAPVAGVSTTEARS